MSVLKFAGMATVSALVVALSACNPTPTVEKVDPQSGPETGVAVKVTGKNFKQGAKIAVNGQAIASTKMESATVLSAELPAHEPGTVKISVINPPDKASKTTVAFEYKDSTAPTVQGYEPAGTEPLPADQEVKTVRVTYSEPVEGGTITVAEEGGTPVTGTTATSEDGMAVTFTADAPLPAGKTYTVTVSGVKDKAGNAAEDTTFSFSIAKKGAAKGKK